MILLVLGLLVWSAAHLFKRAMPDQRAALEARLGTVPAKGLFALAIGAGLLLMITGYRSAPFIALWTPPAWTVHLNNTLMLVAVFLFGAAHSKGRVKQYLRNPMLLSVAIWAVAHLLVNGDLASLILFGGLGLWALAAIAYINASGPWVRPAPGPARSDLILIAITIVMFGVITAIHAWLGYWPFPQ